MQRILWMVVLTAVAFGYSNANAQAPARGGVDVDVNVPGVDVDVDINRGRPRPPDTDRPGPDRDGRPDRDTDRDGRGRSRDNDRGWWWWRSRSTQNVVVNVYARMERPRGNAFSVRTAIVTLPSTRVEVYHDSRLTRPANVRFRLIGYRSGRAVLRFATPGRGPLYARVRGSRTVYRIVTVGR